jgi:nitroreductase
MSARFRDDGDKEPALSGRFDDIIGGAWGVWESPSSFDKLRTGSNLPLRGEELRGEGIREFQMDFFETVRKRRSVCQFSDQPVANKDIMAMLEAAILAPSATNEQPWYFIVIRDKSLKEAMRDVVNAIVEAVTESTNDKLRKKRLAWMQSYSTHFADAPVAIAALARPWVGGGYSESTNPARRDLALESVAMAVAHFQLAATALGYSSCFASSPAEFAREEIEAILHVEKPWFLVGIISLGIAAKRSGKRPARKSVAEVCAFIG